MTALPKGLSQPALRALASIDVQSLEDLTRHSKNEVAALHGMGPKGATLLISTLEQANLSFSR